MNPLTADMESLIDTALKEDVQSGDITTVQPCTPPAKKPRLFRVAYLSLIWFATTISALLFTAYPANASSHLTLTAPANQNYSRDRAITPLQLPEATGGTGTLTYTLTGPGGGPGGLSFNASTRTLSGTPSTRGTFALTYTVTDDNDAGTSVDFTVTVSDLTFVMEPENQNYTRGTAINDLQLPEGTGGTGPLVYTLRGSLSNPSLPTGLRFDPGTRTLSGMPSTVSVTTLTYTVTDGNDASTSATFTVTVNPRLTLSHPVQLSFTQGRAINDDHPILPGAMGGTAPLVYTLTDLPPGLEFDPNTRRLSGTPGTFDRLDPPRSRLVGSPPNQTALYIVIYGVTDANGASARTSTTSEFLSIAISANLTLDGSVPDQKYTVGRPVTLQLPEATGGFGPLTYTLTAPGGLPEGLIFTPETRTLSGALVRQGFPETLTYKVTHDNDASTSTTFTVTGKAKVALDPPTKRSYTRGTAINVDHPILPGATAGTEPLTYTLTALGGGALPVGLEFDPNTRRLSGTPDDIPGDFVLTYMVTDANGSSDNVGFRVAINPGLMLTAPANLNYTLDTEIEGLQLPVATGGTGTLRYTLTGPSGDPLPQGLEFDPNTRTLSGTPSTVSVTTLTYTVTDRNNANTSVTITVMVNPGLALNARGDQNYTQDRAINDLQLPEGTGGTGTLTYTLTGPSGDNLPAGLNFNANTRTLSGTPTELGSTELLYSVTDGNGDSTSVDFRITVNAGLTLIALDDLNYTLDTEIDRLQLPEATGGTAPLVYTLTDPRPNLRFQASTRTLFGRAISIGTNTLTYTVTDANGDSTSMDFTVTVNPGLAPLTAPADQNYTEGNEIDSLPLPVATGGTAPLVYTLTDLPAGLAFNPQTRTLSGTPDADGDFTLTYEVSDANGANTNVTFTVIVSDGLALTPPANQNYTEGNEIDSLPLPVATGGRAPLTYTLTGPSSLPGGLGFDANTRILSGTPSTATNTTTLTYTVTDTNNASTSVTFTVRVNASLGLDTPDDQNYTLDTEIDRLQLPEATGGRAPLTYTLTGPSGLPGGLGFDANTRTLSGTPDTAGTTNLTYRVTDANDATTSVDFTVTVSDLTFVMEPENQNYTQDRAITDLQLPEGTGGTGTLTYTLTSVPGLTFTASTRTLSGTPNTAGTTNLTYRVTDANGDSANATFTVTVNAGLALTASGDQNYTQGTAITGLQLPEASGGTAPLVYTLTGTLPTGLSFTAGTRTLSGTPSTATSTTTLTYTVTDANDATTSVDFTVTVSDLTFVMEPENQNYTQGIPINKRLNPDGNGTINGLQLPPATGGTMPWTYTLTGPSGGPLPAGLSFNPNTGMLSGKPEELDSTTLTYMVMDASGASASVTFTFTVTANLELSAIANLHYTQGTMIPDLILPEATSGPGGMVTYFLNLLNLVPGLTFDPETRTLSGTPSEFRDVSVRYAVVGANGAETTAGFRIIVNPRLRLDTPDNQNYRLGTAIPDLELPEASGGTAPRTYTLTGPSGGNLPAGLNFNASTRILSGTPNTAGTTTLTYTVTDTNGASTNVAFTVNAGLALTAPANQNYTQGTAISNLELPVATGGTGTLTYTLTGVPSLPPGLDFNANTRTLSGTPDTAATTTLTYEVTDTNGDSANATFTVTVNVGLALTAPANQNYTLDTTISNLELPVATGGTGTLTYTLTGVPSLPPGLTFTASTRILSGTPSTATSTTTLTYTVTDANDATTSVDFTVIVNAELALNTPDDQNYTQGTAITGLTLLAASGGTAPLTYTLIGPGDSALPGGLNFNANTRTLSGTPSTADTTILTYEVTDDNGASKSVDFTVIVNADLALTAPANQNYTQGTAISNLQLPEATDGTGTLTYTLTGPSGGNLPAGLIFTLGTRTLSGTPSRPSTTTLTYTVTDDDGASTATFTVRINAGLMLEIPGNQFYTQNTAIPDLTLPAATGGTAPLTYTLTGPRGVPEGLAFNPQTRTLSGAPRAIDLAMLTYTVTDANGASTNATFTIFINSNLTFVMEPENQNYTQDIAINTQLPEATGGTETFAYTLTGQSNVPLPAGLTFNPDTRTLSGTPSMIGTTTLVYSAQDTGDSSIISVGSIFNVEVHPRLEPLTAPDDQNYTQDTKIDDLQLPAATGGTTPLTYTLRGRSNSDPSLPTGLIFDPVTRTLSGTPSTTTGTPTEFGNTELLYSVTDANGDSKSVDFRVTVNPRLALTAPDDQNYMLDTAITGLTLPIATGGTMPLTYTLTNVPGGLSFDPSTRILSGTPKDIIGNFDLTYMVTDTNNASKSVDFTVTISNDLAFVNEPANQNYTQGTKIDDLQLPAATGGTGTLTYTLTGLATNRDLPPGLIFDPATRTLSGTPTELGETRVVYTVTDPRDSGRPTQFGRIFLVTVNPGLALDTPDDQNYRIGTMIPDLQLPEATGGTEPLTYTLTGPGDSALPPGLIFDPVTRTLSGTPDTAGTTTLTYEVTDTNGASTSVDFMVTVNTDLTLDTPADQNYTQGRVIDDLPLPEASGGTGTLTYTLTGPSGGNLPAGLDFNADTRILSGTPDTAGTTTLTYRVTDDNGASTATFTVIVSDGLALTAPANQNYTEDTAIPALTLPEASGGTGTRTYTLTNVSGLNFAAGTRTLSGTPDTAGDFTLTYTVTDANDATTSVDFMVIVSDGLALTTPANQNYTEDIAISVQLPEASGGTAPRTYTLTEPSGGNLPAGLTFSGRTLSGTPTEVGTTTLTYTVTDTNGASTSVDFTVTVNAGLALTAPVDQNYTQGTAITALELPAATGGTTPLVYTLTGPSGGNLPAGLTFTPGTRMLSGTPSTPGTTTLTYMVMDTNGDSANATFMVIVSDGLALTAPTNQNYTQDIAITALELPAATGGTTPLVYTLTGPSGGNLLAGLTFTPGTRMLSGTPSTPGTTTLTYMVMDTNGDSANATFMVIVSDGLALTAPTNQNYTEDIAITALELPAATGGTTPLVYTLTGPSGGNLPAGLTFTPGTRTLSGTPDTADTTVLTYTVTDTNGASTTATFTVMVNASLTLTASGNQNYTLDTAITGLELPVATGGTAPLTYTLTSVSGLDFNPVTRTLSGTPDTADTFDLTYRVTDDNGATTSVDFMVIVSDGLALSARGDQNYTQDKAIPDLELPEASGGTGTRTYTLTGPGDSALPGGLTFSGRTLSGTPDTADTTVLTYTVTDTNGASTTATFTVMVNASLTLTASGNQNYTLDTAITGLELPVATGGTAPLTYTLTSVSGLDFNPVTRTLSGTPDTADTFDLTYRVTDDNGATTSVDFMVIVSDGLALSARGDQNYTQDKAIPDLELPEASGGTGTRTYTLTGPGDSALPGGLTFSGRTLSGTPDTADTTVLTYTVTDTNGASTTATFTVMVNASLTLTASGNQNYTLDTAITGLELPVATGGTAPLTYTLTSVSGLDFNPVTRTLSGTPDTADTFDLTYRVTDDNGATTSVDFMVIVSDGLALSARGDQNYTQDKAIPDLELPEASGGTGTRTYTLTGPGDSALPGGLTFSGRTLSGTPDTADTTVLTYTVTDTNGASTTATFTVMVNASLTLTASGNQNYTLDTAITGLELPVATGGTAPLTYTLTSVSGLDFNPVTRTLSGTPDTADTFDLTYRVTDDNGATTSVDFMVIVSDGLALSARGDQNYTQDKAIPDLELPEASGGTGTRTYTLTGPGDSALPGGLTFSGRTLSGTPDTADTTVLTYTVTDTNGASTTATFTVMVNASLTLTASGNQNYTLDTAITGLELPVATGGTAPLTYTLTSVSGLDFNPVTRTLSGTPDTADTFDLTYRVTDDNGATTSVDFMVIVSDGLALSARGDQNYTQDKAIPDLELPEASGGTGTRTYTLTGPGDSALPGGLTFSGRTLSGTPDTADTTVLTYTVTDTNGASTTATFTVMVNASLTLTASGNQNYTLDTAITGLELPVATGGTAPLTYTLTSVSGLDFNPVTRTLSGTPDTADTFDLTYRVTDDNGATTSVDFMVIVSDGLALSARGDQNYTQDKAIPDLELPEASGGTGTRTYTLTGPGDSALPGGLTFSGRTLSGTPDTADTTVLTYTVTDTNGASTTATFTVMVNASLTLTASGNQNYTLDTAITGLELPVATGGTAPLTYTLTSVSGLDFNPVTRTLSGTPDTADTFDLTYRVTDDNGATTSVDFMVIVSDGLALSARGDQNYTQDKAIPDLELPEASGGTGTRTYTLTGPGDSALPGGLTFSGRTLSGTPDTADTTVLTYTVTDTNGASTTATFTVMVNASLTLTASGNQNYTLDTAITGLELPVATGGTAPLTYTLTSVSGLDFNPVTRTLSGTPDTADTFDLTYRVTDDNGATTSVDFMVIVSDGLALSARGDQNYTQDKAIPDLELPEASGGTGTRTYTLTGPGDSALPGGLTFSGRTLSGTPDTADTTVLTYTVTDTNGASTTATFTVMVKR